MRLIRSIAWLLGGVLASSSQAGFIVTWARTTQGENVPAGMDWIDCFAFNTGGDTGSKLLAVNFGSVATTGGRIYFKVDDLKTPTLEPNGTIVYAEGPDGIPDTLDPTNQGGSGAYSTLKIGSGSPWYLGFDPAMEQQPNAYAGGVTHFAGSIAVPGAGVTADVVPYRFARFVVDDAAQLTFSGKVGGDRGPAVNFVLPTPDPVDPPPVDPPPVDPPPVDPPPVDPPPPPPPPSGPVHPTIQFAPSAHFVWDANWLDGATFSTRIYAYDQNTEDLLSLTIPTQGNVVTDVVITGGGAGQQVFEVSGHIAREDLVPETLVYFRLSDGTHEVGGAFGFAFPTPEPTSLGAFCLMGVFLRRQRP